MAKRLITRAELARLADVSKAAITKRCAKDLAGACEGNRVDLDHASVQRFLKDRGKAAPAPARAPTNGRKLALVLPHDPTGPADAPSAKRRAPPAPGPEDGEGGESWSHAPGSDEDLDEIARLIEPLFERFGHVQVFKDWRTFLKDNELIREKRLKNEETETTLINREFVQVHLLSYLEETNKRLLSDMPSTLASLIYSMHSAGAPTEEAEREIRTAVSSHLVAVNRKLSKSLREIAKRAAEKNAGGNAGPGAVAGRADRSSDD